MRSSLLLFLLLGSCTACSPDLQQVLAPDPHLLPSPSITSSAPSQISESSPVAIIPTASPSTSPKPSESIASPSEPLTDLTALQVFSPTEARFAASKGVTRRDYARWLVAAHNAIYQTQPSQQIKLATPEKQPVFTDVPPTHPDFPTIQGLAEAGIVPSPLRGDKTKVFEPDLPLTREQLLLWKVPLDRRQALPPATLADIQKAWGFQDTAQISPVALSAILADRQSGDFANIHRAFGYTTLLQPRKPVTFAEVVATIWYFGTRDGRSAHDALHPVSSSPSP